METIEALRQARELITPEDRFCRGQYAKTEHGTPASPTMSNAYRFCGLGAVRKVTGTYRDHAAVEALKAAASDLYDMDVADVNDEIGHDAILKVFDKAILNESERANEAQG